VFFLLVIIQIYEKSFKDPQKGNVWPVFGISDYRFHNQLYSCNLQFANLQIIATQGKFINLFLNTLQPGVHAGSC